MFSKPQKRWNINDSEVLIILFILKNKFFSTFVDKNYPRNYPRKQEITQEKPILAK